MSLTIVGLLSYAAALAAVIATPGPVVAALIARAATGGVGAVMPLIVGVAVGDVIWALIALLGVGAAVNAWAGLLTVLRFFGAGILAWMGWRLIRSADSAAQTAASGDLVHRCGWDGFMAGLMVIAGNPKAMLFYVGVLPGFFDLTDLTVWDLAAICAVSAIVPFTGNVAWSALFARTRRFLKDRQAMYRLHLGAGVALVLVALAIVAAA